MFKVERYAEFVAPGVWQGVLVHVLYCTHYIPYTRNMNTVEMKV